MKFYIILSFFVCFATNAQDQTTYITVENKKKKPESPVFVQCEFALPFRLNENRGAVNLNGTQNNDWFIPNGLSASIGLGLQKNKWIAISAHSGIDWIVTQKIVAIPIYGNLRLSPRIYDDSRLVLQIGLGKGFAIGQGNLYGNFQKYSLGYETDEDLNVFIVASGYNMKQKNKSAGYLGLGFSVRR